MVEVNSKVCRGVSKVSLGVLHVRVPHEIGGKGGADDLVGVGFVEV